MGIEFNEGYARDIIEIGERSKSNSHRLDEVESAISDIKRENQAIHDIATSVKLIAQDVNYIKSDVSTVKASQSDLRKELTEVKAKPQVVKAQWVDKAIAGLVGAISVGVLSYLLNIICPTIFG